MSTGTTVRVIALQIDALLVAASSRAARRPIRLPVALGALAGRGIGLDPAGAEADALVVTADVALAAIDIDALAVDAGLTGWTVVTAGATVGGITVEMDASVSAAGGVIRTTVLTFALADLTNLLHGATGKTKCR